MSMLIRITQTVGYGDRFGVFHPCGAEWDAPESIGAKLVSRGIAVVAEKPKTKAPAEVVETAAVAPPENAAKRTSKAPARKKD